MLQNLYIEPETVGNADETLLSGSAFGAYDPVLPELQAVEINETINAPEDEYVGNSEEPILISGTSEQNSFDNIGEIVPFTEVRNK